MKRYVTRWALSTGIRIVEGENTGPDARYFFARRIGVFVASKEAHETLEAAMVCAKKMATKKVVSLRKQADKLADPAWTPKIIDETGPLP